jgi:hypothetical protein
VKIVTSTPTLLGSASTTEFQAKLSFLRDVAWLRVDDLNNAAPLLGYSLNNRLRPRFFYALNNAGALERNKLSSLTFCSEATYLRKVHQLVAPANEDAVKRYKQTVASADFQAWAAQEEAQRRRDATAQRAQR